LRECWEKPKLLIYAEWPRKASMRQHGRRDLKEVRMEYAWNSRVYYTLDYFGIQLPHISFSSFCIYIYV
jgi:hypothetical protein